MREPTSAFAEEHQDLKSEKRRDSPTVLENNLDDVEEKRIERRLLLKLDLRSVYGSSQITMCSAEVGKKEPSSFIFDSSFPS